MNPFRKLFKREGTSSQMTIVTSTDVLGREVMVNDPTQAMKIAAVYRAVNLISNGVASLTLQYKRFNVFKKYFYVDNDVFVGKRMNYLLTIQPNARMNAFDFWKAAVCQILLRGNAYIYPVKDQYDDVSELILLSNGCVAYDAVANTYQVYDYYNGISGRFTSADIIHLKNYSDDGYTGMSTISYAAKVLGIAATSDSETLNRFASGGRYKAIISNNHSVKGFGEHQDSEIKSAAEDFERELRSGKDIISIPGDVTVNNMNMTSADMQFLDSRKFTIREIARFFNVPACKLMDDSNNVYGSAEMANLSFYSEALQPITTTIEREFNSKILGMARCQSYKFEYNLTSLFALDRKGMAEWNMSRLQTGQVSVNDLRRESGMEPVGSEGDELYMSVNLAPLGSQKLSGAPTDNGNE